jgi:hypothetical protein
MASATDLYIQNFAANEATCCPITGWMHDNPEDVKIAQFAALFFGALALVTLPITFSASVTLGVFMIAAGALSLLASLASWVFLNYVTCAHNDMSVHVFTEGECEAGRLYYRGDVPVLELKGDTPEKNGWAHGFLLGKEINELYDNMELALHTILQQPQASALPKTLAAMRNKIPHTYQLELNGLAHGFNAWAEKNNAERRLTSDDFLLIHLLPDSKHFQPYEHEINPNLNYCIFPAFTDAACTTILHKDERDEVVFARNMDWCPFGQAGAKSLVIVWKTTFSWNGDTRLDTQIAALTLPGMVGVISGWNQQKLCLAMNVCPGTTQKVRGMPAVFLNRVLLESAPEVQKVNEQLLNNFFLQPLGPYHVTLASSDGAAECISYYQGEEGSHLIRKMPDEKPLFTVNWCYPECEGGYFNSQERTELLGRYFEGATREIPEEELEKQKLIRQALRIRPYVNSFITMHSLLFLPQSDSVELSWDNGYAASQPAAQLSLTEVFN